MNILRDVGMAEGQTFSPGYPAVPPYVCPFQSNTNVVTEIPKPSFAETVFDTDGLSRPSGRRSRIRPEQKPFFMFYIIRKITTGIEMLLDLFMDTGDTSKACLLEPES